MGYGIDNHLMNLMMNNNPLMFQNQINYFNNNGMNMNNPILNQMIYPMKNINSPMMNMNNQMNNPLKNQMSMNNQKNNQMNNQMNNPMIHQMNNQMNIPMLNIMNNPMLNQMNSQMNNMKNNMINTNNQMNNPKIQINNNMMIQMNNPINNINCPIMGQNNNNNIFNQGYNYNFNNNLNLNTNQMKLINLIFKFYEEHKDSNKNIFMHFEHPQQVKSLINHLFPNYSELKQIYDDDNDINNIYGELLPYIHEEKKIIKFINSNKMLYNIKIPCSISKSDLYGIAQLYKGQPYTYFILIHNNVILNNDDSSIEDISNGDSIIIIEDRIYPDKSYYLSIQKKYENNQNRKKINVVFGEIQGLLENHNFILSHMTTVTEMIYSIYLFFGLDYRNLRIIFNGITVEPNETTIINYLKRRDCANIQGYKKQNDRNLTDCKLIGKVIIATLLNDKNKEEIKVKVGRLNNTKVLFCPEIGHGFGHYKKILRKVYNIYIDNIEIKYEDNQSFSSLGIKEDFVCRIKLK